MSDKFILLESLFIDSFLIWFFIIYYILFIAIVFVWFKLPTLFFLKQVYSAEQRVHEGDSAGWTELVKNEVWQGKLQAFYSFLQEKESRYHVCEDRPQHAQRESFYKRMPVNISDMLRYRREQESCRDVHRPVFC